uniref:Chemokine interleukin-8-like domain-containing protein n=1 Tax=Phasianus colchicus TaxID=9054 RepID=A0A669Q3C7_PHACC
GQRSGTASARSDQPTAPAMSARLLLPLLLSAVVASCWGAPPAGELRCRCVRAVAERIPPRHLVQVELIPEGPHCAVPEVIATTKQGHTLCLSPSVPWVKLHWWGSSGTLCYLIWHNVITYMKLCM